MLAVDMLYLDASERFTHPFATSIYKNNLPKSIASAKIFHYATIVDIEGQRAFPAAQGRALVALLTLFSLSQNFPMATLVGADTLNNIISFERIQLPFNALYGHF